MLIDLCYISLGWDQKKKNSSCELQTGMNKKKKLLSSTFKLFHGHAVVALSFHPRVDSSGSHVVIDSWGFCFVFDSRPNSHFGVHPLGSHVISDPFGSYLVFVPHVGSHFVVDSTRLSFRRWLSSWSWLPRLSFHIWPSAVILYLTLRDRKSRSRTGEKRCHSSALATHASPQPAGKAACFQSRLSRLSFHTWLFRLSFWYLTRGCHFVSDSSGSHLVVGSPDSHFAFNFEQLMWFLTLSSGFPPLVL